MSLHRIYTDGVGVLDMVVCRCQWDRRWNLRSVTGPKLIPLPFPTYTCQNLILLERLFNIVIYIQYPVLSNDRMAFLLRGSCRKEQGFVDLQDQSKIQCEQKDLFSEEHLGQID